MGERAHHVDRLVDPVPDRVESVDPLGHLAPERFGDQREPDPQCQQLLLGAVVEIALEPAALALGDRLDAVLGLAEAAARGAQVLDQAGVLEDDEAVGRRGLDQARVLPEAAVVQDRGDALARRPRPR